MGAFIGPLLAIGAMLLFSNNIHAVLWIAVIPAFIALAILVVGVKEPETHHRKKIKVRIKISDIRKVGSAYWQLVTIAGIFTFAKFSDAFLILKAQDVGFSITFVPFIMVLMNIVIPLL